MLTLTLTFLLFSFHNPFLLVLLQAMSDRAQNGQLSTQTTPLSSNQSTPAIMANRPIFPGFTAAVDPLPSAPPNSVPVDVACNSRHSKISQARSTESLATGQSCPSIASSVTADAMLVRSQCPLPVYFSLAHYERLLHRHYGHESAWIEYKVCLVVLPFVVATAN
jgi:hypothetical protein